MRELKKAAKSASEQAERHDKRQAAMTERRQAAR